MGIYGVDFYGTAYYGAPLYLSFDARPFTAEPVGYGALRLRWVNPRLDWEYDDVEEEWVLGSEGQWSQLRVVRSSYGFPIFPEDGVTVLEQGTESITTFIDNDVREGRFYYYSIFVFEVENEQWVRAGDTIGLPTKDHAYGGRLFELMPQFMRQADLERRTAAHDAGPLLRYLNILGMSLDHLRTEYETLRWLRNPERISGGLIWPLAEMFGIPFEPAIGMRQARVWLRDAVYLYRIKGTRPGVEAAASAMTGWGARVTRGKNLIRLEGGGAWFSDAEIEDTDSPDDPSIETMLVTSATDPVPIRSAPLAYTSATTLPRWHGIGVEELTDYSLSAEIRPTSGATDGRDFRLVVEWYDEEGEFISSINGASVATSSSSWVDMDLVDNSPAGAAYAVIELEDLGTGGTEVYIRRVQFERAITPTSWEPARAIIINFDPVRWNFIPNPAFSNGLYGWSIESGTGGLEDGTVGPSSGSQHAVLDGEMVSDMLGIATAGVPHVFSIYAEGSGDITLGIEFFEDPGDPEPVLTTEEVHTLGGSVERVSVGISGPADVLFARVTVTTTASVALGSSLFEEGSVPGDYFDGDFFGADYLWAGSAGVSASKYYPARAERNVRVRELIPDYLPIGQRFVVNYIGGAPSSGALASGDEGTMGFGTYGVMPFGQ